MKYDFTTIMDRRGKDAIAVDMVGTPDTFAPGAPKEGFDVIPMWVADMNFPVVPSIQQAMQERISHPAFGYFDPTEDYFNAIIRWQETRNGVKNLKKEHIGYENGVLGGVVSAMQVFCSPHNPTGRVWERWEVAQAMVLFRKDDVMVVSDEIWSDILLDGHKHVPTQSVSEDATNRTVALYAPSKTFNLAGLVGSYHIIYNDTLRHRHDKESSLSHYNSMNVMSMHALIGAYSLQGQEWVQELCEVLSGNVDYAVKFIGVHFPGFRVSRPHGTYMLFLDCVQWCKEKGKDVGALLKAGWDVGVAWQDGRPFHGPYHIRVNLALPLSRVQEAFNRLKEYVF